MRSAILVMLLLTSSARAAEPFFLAGPKLPLGAVLVLGALDGEPAAGAPVVMTTDDEGFFVSARPLPRPPAPFDALVGQKVALHGPSGKVCTATIAAVVAVRWGTVSGETRVRVRAPGWQGEPLWKGTGDVKPWQTYAAATLGDPSGPCDGALFAVPASAAAASSRLAAADPTWRESAERAFLDSEVVRLASEKAALEGGRHSARLVSVRRVGPAEGPSLALLYGALNGRRLIVVHAVKGAAFNATTELGAVFAESPSFVAGVDADQDGRADVVIGHPRGVTLFRADGELACLIDGRWGANRACPQR